MAPLDQQQYSCSCSLMIHASPSSKSSEATPPPSPLHCKFDLSESSLPSPLESLTPPLIQKTDITSKAKHYESFLSTSAPLRILAAIAMLIGTPYILYSSFPAETVASNLLFIKTTWDALLRFSSVHVSIISLAVSVYYGPCCLSRCTHKAAKGTCCAGIVDGRWSSRLSRCTGLRPSTSRSLLRRFRSFVCSVDGVGLMLALAMMLPLTATTSLPMLAPGWWWYPFGLDFKVYHSSQLEGAMDGLCMDQPMHEILLPRQSLVPPIFRTAVSPEDRKHLPLCLTEDSWHTLSAGALSSHNVRDVKTVLRGIDYAKHQSGGLAIAVLARDIMEDLPAFQQNVESLKHFFSDLSVVFFENDSKDGSRDAIKAWATVADGYQVDLMECAEAVDCKMGKKHRDLGGGSFAKSKAVGDMDVFRQRVADYITESRVYSDYSHMMVIDIDLAVSVSPLGVLHSLGKHPENAVASSGRQLFPASLGTIAPPYDFSAFRPWATEDNQWILTMHDRWCGLMPSGDRWRNMCDVTSPSFLVEMLRMDRGVGDKEDFYRVESAFNGAVLYPLDQVRESEATYDAGEDGQRCEHIGFNLAMTKPMYVNRKWDFHVDPTNPGGPTGWRAQNVIKHITTTPRLVVALAISQLLPFLVFVHCLVTLGIFLVYPLLSPVLSGSKSLRRLISHNRFNRRRRIKNSGGTRATDEETLFKLV